jgi:hypothetical protein
MPRKTSLRLHLNTRQLTLLVHLDEDPRLSRAASATGLTQSAASKLLRQVETALDVKLFERHARGVIPTRYGEILLRHARLALSELALAHEGIFALKSGVCGYSQPPRNQPDTDGGCQDEAAPRGNRHQRRC